MWHSVTISEDCGLRVLTTDLDIWRWPQISPSERTATTSATARARADPGYAVARSRPRRVHECFVRSFVRTYSNVVPAVRDLEIKLLRFRIIFLRERFPYARGLVSLHLSERPRYTYSRGIRTDRGTAGHAGAQTASRARV